ncbi:MAG: cytochrome b/b6 domain-containing protein [Pseudomonadales bacterium]|nr:cytochrome b/b6 domain-containing protein [Pseudomonadales bacterium]
MQTIDTEVYRVWDRGVRGFHWINLVSMLGLLGTGLVIYNGKTLGISGDGKVFLKELHVWCGYVFVANLAWRMVQGFTGSHFARWGTILRLDRQYVRELRNYLGSLRDKDRRSYLGHNPLGRLMVIALLLLMTLQAITGLVLAGTDLYYPPLGAWIANWVAASGVDPSTLLPGDKSMVDTTAWDEMRTFRGPFIFLHEQVFFVLMGATVLHIAGVVVAEFKERNGLISAMITGEKRLVKPPVDLPRASEADTDAV